MLLSTEMERDELAARVKEMEKDKNAILVRFRAATESRQRLEKTVKKLSRPASAGPSPIITSTEETQVLGSNPW